MILIDGFEIDCAEQEQHAFDSEVTEHPVENGADIADHIRARPVTVTMSGIVSDTPIGDLASRRALFSRPSEEAYTRLLAIRDRRQPVTITTSLGTFERMALSSLSSTPRTADGFFFTATFVQINVVTNLRTTVRVAVPRAKGKLNRGAKPATPVPEAPPPSAKTANHVEALDAERGALPEGIPVR